MSGTPRSPSRALTRASRGALDGHYNSGRVYFERIDDSTTKVSVEMEHETEGMVETLGSALGFDSRQIKADLERFKEYIESRGTETGAWRGEVQSARASVSAFSLVTERRPWREVGAG